MTNLQTDLELFYDKFDPGGIGSILPADFECGTRLIFCVARLMCEWLPLICALLVVIEFHFCRDVTLVVNVASYALIAIEMSGSPVLVFLFTFLEWKGRE